MGELWSGEVMVCSSCGVGQFQFVGVMMVTKPKFVAILSFFTFSAFSAFQIFTTAKPFDSAHFAH